jgi:hypothetical protein
MPVGGTGGGGGIVADSGPRMSSASVAGISSQALGSGLGGPAGSNAGPSATRCAPEWLDLHETVFAFTTSLVIGHGARSSVVAPASPAS